MRSVRVVALVAGALLAGSVSALAAPIGPTAYLQQSDSPFFGTDFSGGYFYLEDFEDHALNTPGVAGVTGGPASITFGPTFHDSVDADDGAIDGSGLQGDSWFFGGASTGFTFNAAALGGLPTHVGIVWTDGPFGTPVSFIAMNADGTAAACSIGPAAGFANNSFNGETAEDRFFGCVDAGGISSIQVINQNGGGIEVDHLQYGLAVAAPPVPEPASVTLLLLGAAAAGYRRMRRRE